jgi:hypothetical protein
MFPSSLVDDARHLVEAEQMRGEHPAGAGDYAVLFVDQHRVGEAKFADRGAICATCWSLCVRAFLPLGCDAYPDAAFICSKPSLAK